MELHRYSRYHWELESLRQVHHHHHAASVVDRKETGSTSETEGVKSSATYSTSAALIRSSTSSATAPPHNDPLQQHHRREPSTTRVSELGHRIAGYLESSSNPVFLVRRDDFGSGGNGSRGGGATPANTPGARNSSPEVVIIPLSPNSTLASPTFSRGAKRFYGARKALLVPFFAFLNILLFLVTMSRNNCPAHEHTCIFSGLKRFSFQPLGQNPLLGPSAQTLLHMGGLESGLVASGGQSWRLFTCIWLHAGVFHLLLNMLGLLTLGLRVEQEFGKMKLGLVYVLSGLAGSLLSALFLRPLTISVGASGALFGVMGSLVSELLINGSRNWFLLSQLIILLIINLALGKMPHVDNYAHVGGCIAGFLLGFVLLQKPNKLVWRPHDRDEHHHLLTPNSVLVTTGTPATPVRGVPAHEFLPSAPAIAAHFNDHQLLQTQHHQHQQHQQNQQHQQHQPHQHQNHHHHHQQKHIVSLPRYKFVVWVVALNLLVVLYLVALIVLFRGVNVRKKCRWCTQLL